MIELTRLIRFDHWANLETASALKKAIPPPNEAVTALGHIVGIQEIWLSRVEGSASSLSPWPQLSLASAEDWIGRLAHRWQVVLIGKTTETIVSYRDSREQRQENTLMEIVQEVVLHDAHHRGQIALLLRTAGHEPPTSTDFVPALRKKSF